MSIQCFLQVIWKYFYSRKSAREHGTLYQLRNLLCRTNVVSKPKNDFNACDDFFKLVTTCHILAAALEVLGMNSLPDTPSPTVLSDPHNMWMETDVRRKAVLKAICQKIVKQFTHFSFSETGATSPDHVQMYSRQLLSLGCFYLEYCDAIQEGDGDRVLRCWRYLLPIFQSSGRKNYSIEALQMLYQYHYKLTPRQAEQLLWNRFVNIHGLPGRNIPCDLHQEHLNRVCKRAIYDLGVNKTAFAITRVGKALGTISPLLNHFDQQNHIHDSSGTHRAPTSEKDRDTVIRQLQHTGIFSSVQVRSHYTFPEPRDVLHAKSHDKLLEWMVNHIS